MIVFVKHLQFSILLLILIFTLTLMPSNEVPSSSGIQLDKIIHFTLFFCFAFSLIIGLLKQYFIKVMNKSALKFTIVISVLLSFITEFFQYLMHVGRNFDWTDILFNILGILFALIVFFWIKGKDDLCIN
ncbi:MAG: VanZ like family [Bacteroidota bacterium]